MFRLIYMNGWYAAKMLGIYEDEVERIEECVGSGDIIAYCEDLETFANEIGVDIDDIRVADTNEGE